MKKLLFIFSLVAILTFSSCGSSLERKVKIDRVANIEVKGLSAITATAVVTNRSRRNIELSDVVLTLKKNGERVAVLSLKDEVIVVPRRSEQIDIATLWRLSNVDIVNALSFKSGVSSEELAGFRVDVRGEVKSGMVKHSVDAKNIKLDKLVKEMRK